MQLKQCFIGKFITLSGYNRKKTKIRKLSIKEGRKRIAIYTMIKGNDRNET